MQVLQAQGQELVAPGDRQGLHPLLVPLASQQLSSAPDNGHAEPSGDVLTCILRWPDESLSRVSLLPNSTGHSLCVVQTTTLVSHPQSVMQGLPVVRMARGALKVDLLARSADEYIHRCGALSSLSLTAVYSRPSLL